MSQPATKYPAHVFLTELEATASITYDPRTSGWVLSIGEAEQSHVDLNDPTRIFYEYLHRIASVIDLLRPPHKPIRALHLGGGAMTLARYIAATRPESLQTIVELARALPGFVTTHIPMPPGTNPEILCGDARSMLPAASQTAAVPADVIILDIFSGADAPKHLRERAFYEDLSTLLAPHGVLVINVGDDPGLAFFHEQATVLGATDSQTHPSVFEHVWLLADSAMLTGTRAGNLILLASKQPIPHTWQQALLQAGPHPGSVLDSWELSQWLATLC